MPRQRHRARTGPTAGNNGQFDIRRKCRYRGSLDTQPAGELPKSHRRPSQRALPQLVQRLSAWPNRHQRLRPQAAYPARRQPSEFPPEQTRSQTPPRSFVSSNYVDEQHIEIPIVHIGRRLLNAARHDFATRRRLARAKRRPQARYSPGIIACQQNPLESVCPHARTPITSDVANATALVIFVDPNIERPLAKVLFNICNGENFFDDRHHKRLPHGQPNRLQNPETPVGMAADLANFPLP